MKTKLTIPPTFSAERKTLDLHVPTAWQDLTQEQLRHAAHILNIFMPPTAQLLLLKRFTGIRFLSRGEYGWHCVGRLQDGKGVPFFLDGEDLCQMVAGLNWLLSPGQVPVRLDEIDGFCAVDAQLHQVTFGDYLECENLYQGYLQTRQEECLTAMAAILYRDKDQNRAAQIRCNDDERLLVFLWYAEVKNLFARLFPHFFQPQAEDVSEEGYSMMDRMNAQIRALTAGDITKEEVVLGMDCWRALTELNEKAREAQEFKQKYGK